MTCDTCCWEFHSGTVTTCFGAKGFRTMTTHMRGERNVLLWKSNEDLNLWMLKHLKFMMSDNSYSYAYSNLCALSELLDFGAYVNVDFYALRHMSLW